MGSHSRQVGPKGKERLSERPMLCSLSQFCVLIVVFFSEKSPWGSEERPEVSFLWISPCTTHEARRKMAALVVAHLHFPNYVSLLRTSFICTSSTQWCWGHALCLRPVPRETQHRTWWMNEVTVGFCFPHRPLLPLRRTPSGVHLQNRYRKSSGRVDSFPYLGLPSVMVLLLNSHPILFHFTSHQRSFSPFF